MNKFVALLIAAVAVQPLSGQAIQFIGENIDFSIDNNRFSINGIYYFVNSSERAINQSILFPYSNTADSVSLKRVYNLSRFHPIDFQQVDNAITFTMHLEPKDTLAVNIAYSQKTDTINEYILVSAQSWGKALKWARYSFRHDTSVKIDRLSLPPDSVASGVYYWNKVDFYPRENFTVCIDR